MTQSSPIHSNYSDLIYVNPIYSAPINFQCVSFYCGFNILRSEDKTRWRIFLSRILLTWAYMSLTTNFKDSVSFSGNDYSVGSLILPVTYITGTIGVNESKRSEISAQRGHTLLFGELNIQLSCFARCTMIRHFTSPYLWHANHVAF